jgi:hypothetical protein
LGKADGGRVKLPEKVERVLISPFYLVFVLVSETFFFFERHYKRIWKTFSTLATLGLVVYAVYGGIIRPRDFVIVCAGAAVVGPLYEDCVTRWRGHKALKEARKKRKAVGA